MTTTLKVAKGISSATVMDVPDQWSAEWFRKFIRTQLGNADIRNAVVGSGNISITGTSTQPATIDVGTGVKGLFNEPFALVAAPTDALLTRYRVLTPQSGVLTMVDGGAAGQLTVGVAANGIGNAQFRQAGGVSVVGNSSGTPGNVADIPAGADGQLLRRLAGALGFGTVTLADTTGLGTSFTTSGLTAGQVLRATGTTAAAFQQLSFGDLSGQATLAQLPNITNNTILGNVSGGPTVPAALTQAQLTALVNAFTAGISGAVPASGGGTTKFLRADASFQPAVTSVALLDASGAPIYSVSGSPVTTSGTLSITLATQAANVIFSGPNTGAAAQPTFRALVAADIPALGANPSVLIGLIAKNGTALTYVRSDGAPAIDQSIGPTWTGAHVHSPTSGVGLTHNATSANPAVFNGFNGASGAALSVVGQFTGGGTTNLLSLSDVNNLNGVNVLLTGNGVTTPNKYLRVQSGNLQILNSGYGAVILTLTDVGAFTVSGPVGINGNAAAAQVTGFGTPTGTGVIANFPGATATLPQCSQAIAQLIKDLKAFGLYGT